MTIKSGRKSDEVFVRGRTSMWPYPDTNTTIDQIPFRPWGDDEGIYMSDAEEKYVKEEIFPTLPYGQIFKMTQTWLENTLGLSEIPEGLYCIKQDKLTGYFYGILTKLDAEESCICVGPPVDKCPIHGGNT